MNKFLSYVMVVFAFGLAFSACLDSADLVVKLFSAAQYVRATVLAALTCLGFVSCWVSLGFTLAGLDNTLSALDSE